MIKILPKSQNNWFRIPNKWLEESAEKSINKEEKNSSFCFNCWNMHDLLNASINVDNSSVRSSKECWANKMLKCLIQMLWKLWEPPRQQMLHAHQNEKLVHLIPCCISSPLTVRATANEDEAEARKRTNHTPFEMLFERNFTCECKSLKFQRWWQMLRAKLNHKTHKTSGSIAICRPTLGRTHKETKKKVKLQRRMMGATNNEV